jgi:hypothetical protein
MAIRTQIRTRVDVYTCDIAYESTNDSVYDLLAKVSLKFLFDLFLLKCVDRPLQYMLDEELDPYLACMQIVNEIVRGIVRGFVHV